MRGRVWQGIILKAVSVDGVWLDDVTFKHKVGGSESDYAGNASEVRTYGIGPTPRPFENVGSLIIKIIVVIEGWRCELNQEK